MIYLSFREKESETETDTKGADVRDWIYDRVRRRKISAVCGRAPRLDRPGMPSVGDVTPACLSAPSDCIGQV